jgi:CheY-like chemotaxis protein
MLCKVLIAEDEEIEREFLKNLLKEHFQNIVEVYTAKKIQNSPINFLLLKNIGSASSCQKIFNFS